MIPVTLINTTNGIHTKPDLPNNGLYKSVHIKQIPFINDNNTK
jgi:hypothetical protein